jgi:hypothetical protein
LKTDRAVAAGREAIVGGRTRLFRNQVAVADRPRATERGVAVAGPGFGMQRLREVAAGAGLPHQRLGEWCYEAKYEKSAKVMIGQIDVRYSAH